MENIDQGTEMWHKFRKTGLGSSDAPVVLDVSPWKTRFQLFLEKTTETKFESNNWATKRGHELEPKARAHYELLNDREMPPALVRSKEYPFLIASLDGYSSYYSIVLEIKCPGKDDHEKAKNGIVPEKYYPQIQHQLLVTGAKECHYYSFDGEVGHLVIVNRNEQYLKFLLKEEKSFWFDYIVNKKPPVLNIDDLIMIANGYLKQDKKVIHKSRNGGFFNLKQIKERGANGEENEEVKENKENVLMDN